MLPRITESPSVATFALVLAPVIDIVMATVVWLLFLRGPAAGPTRTWPWPPRASSCSRSPRSAPRWPARTAASRSARSSTSAGSPATPCWPSRCAGRRRRSRPGRSRTASTSRRWPGHWSCSPCSWWRPRLTIASIPRGGATATTLALLAVVMVAILVRQVLLLVDNDRLRARLEQRVIERSTELAEVTQRTDLMVNSVEDGVYGVDSQGRVSFVNPAGARLLGGSTQRPAGPVGAPDVPLPPAGRRATSGRSSAPVWRSPASRTPTEPPTAGRCPSRSARARWSKAPGFAAWSSCSAT